MGEWNWRWIFWFTFLPVFSPIIFYWLDIVRSLFLYVKFVFVFLELFKEYFFLQTWPARRFSCTGWRVSTCPITTRQTIHIKVLRKSLLFSFWILILTFTFNFLHWTNYSHSKFPRKSIFFSSLFSSHFSSPNKPFKFKFKGKDINFVYFDFFILCSKN